MPDLTFSYGWTEHIELLELKMNFLCNSVPLPDGMHLLIIDRPCLAEEYGVGEYFKFVMITQDLSNDTRADVGHIPVEGFGILNLVEQHPSR